MADKLYSVNWVSPHYGWLYSNHAQLKLKAVLRSLVFLEKQELVCRFRAMEDVIKV